MWLLLLAGCLVNTGLYEARKAELASQGQAPAGGDGTAAGDADGDGFTVEQGDCDDGDPSVFPGADEVPYDTIDNDCEDGDLVDIDGDGEPSDAAGGADCDDTDPSVFPGAEETWDNGVTDNDCDGEREPVTASFADTAVVGESAGGQFGRRIAPLGDVDGDGVAEFLVAAPYESTEVELGGAVYLVNAAGSRRADAFPTLFHSEAAALLSTVAGGPDVDGDGVPDAVVGATNLAEGTGAAWFVSGAAWAAEDRADVERVAGARILGEAEGGYFGSDATFFGDVNGDGLTDVGISASLMDAGTPAAGVVGLWTAADLADGSVTEAGILDAEALYVGWFEDQGLGGRNDVVGDLDGDGYDDLLLSGRGVLGTVVPGGPRPADPEADALFQLSAYTTETVCAVQMVGDLDGDGKSDLSCAQVGSVLFYVGLTATPFRNIDQASLVIETGENSFTFDVVDLGDRDGDSRSESIIAVQQHGVYDTAVMAVLFGSQYAYGDEIRFDDLPISTRSARPYGAFGYRNLLLPDVDGDGNEDLVVSGYADSEGGFEAGAISLLPVPQ